MLYFQQLGGSRALPSFAPAEKHIIQLCSGQLAALRMQALFQNNVHLSRLSRHCLSKKPVPGCLTKGKCPSSSFGRADRVRISLSQFILSPDEREAVLFWCSSCK